MIYLQVPTHISYEHDCKRIVRESRWLRHFKRLKYFTLVNFQHYYYVQFIPRRLIMRNEVNLTWHLNAPRKKICSRQEWEKEGWKGGKKRRIKRAWVLVHSNWHRPKWFHAPKAGVELRTYSGRSNNVRKKFVIHDCVDSRLSTKSNVMRIITIHSYWSRTTWRICMGEFSTN